MLPQLAVRVLEQGLEGRDRPVAVKNAEAESFSTHNVAVLHALPETGILARPLAL